MRIDLSTILPCTYTEAIQHVMTPQLLCHVAFPLVIFKPVTPPVFPDEWKPGTYWVKLRLFGILSFGKQAVVISYPELNNVFSIRDNGHSKLISVWDHLITITELNGQTQYRDTVEIKAGLFTFFIWIFAQVFYRHRQRRWRALARKAFKYGN